MQPKNKKKKALVKVLESEKRRRNAKGGEV